ncbi:hypothetical protein [Micromonospora parathelypteridis]|uniref:Uncharacterized protein n=1 Tax=Micromonospora parathelypteridis TaxID=1839617 RepID=A0A840VN30_9ACTN|nr:hypothetical protein [Micromonospora parathelypteridis]MBB5478392.1 hypothetical protein [Micromonospora parathelypteridis]GGO06486.1 hypothetical protein GCM10011576_10200 [Micromonospora parathelypteridis]
MDLPTGRAATVRAFGTISLVAGFITCLLTNSSDYDGLRPQILAAFLILTGIGLRIEAAIVDRMR